MSYISKMKQEIKKDIQFCEELLKKDYIEGKEFSNIIGKYKTIYNNFSDGFKNYASFVGARGPNQIENLRILKSKLEVLLIEIENPEYYQKKSGTQTFNFHNSNNNINNNNNTNSNSVSIDMTLEQIRDNINENTCLGEEQKEELLLKLNEIEELQKSNESKTQKWNVAKGILKFIVDKGADIAIMFLPQILKAIQ